MAEEIVILEHPHTGDEQRVSSEDPRMLVLMGHGYRQVLSDAKTSVDEEVPVKEDKTSEKESEE